MAANQDPIAGKRLDSWKEVAAFFGRDERTVKRWEKERGLPIYRVPGSARGGVFAYAEELAQWLTGAESADSVPREEISPMAVELAKPLPSLQEIPVAPQVAVLPTQTKRRTMLLWALPLLLVGGVIFLFSSGHRPTNFGRALAASHGPSAEAQDFYLKGRYYWDKRTPDDLNRAVDDFTQAIVRDPSYAKAYVGLADCYNLLREYGTMPPAEAFPRALAAAQKAVELDPVSAEAHNSLAFVLFWGKLDISGAERHFRRALALDPQNAQAHHWYATFLAETGRFSQALSEIERARQLDPSSKAIVADKGFVLLISGQIDQAQALLATMAKTEPEFESAHNYLADIYYERGEYDRYFQEEEVTAQLRHDAAAQRTLAAEEKIFAASGFQGVLKSRLQSDQKRYAQGEANDFRLAAEYAQLGQKTEALRYLESAYQKHDLELTGARVNTELRSLHHEPEFQQLLAKTGFPPIP
jgi:Tfp pilus assembly protein PilF